MRYVEPDAIVVGSAFSNDPAFGQLWGMHNTGQLGGTPDADIDAPEAWDVTTGSADVVVGVIDTGIDYKHPDLKDNMWVNVAELNGRKNVDDDTTATRTTSTATISSTATATRWTTTATARTSPARSPAAGTTVSASWA